MRRATPCAALEAYSRRASEDSDRADAAGGSRPQQAERAGAASAATAPSNAAARTATSTAEQVLEEVHRIAKERAAA